MTEYDYTPAFRDLQRTMQQVSTQLASGIQSVATQVEGVDQRVGSVSRDVTTTRSELAELRGEFEEFVQQATRTAAVQQSETKVGNLKAQLDREFGHYAVVRRTSVGMLHAFDVGNVSNQTVQSVSEELMIQSPRYWLAPALVALAAWSRDNQELADKSVRAAFARDANKTSLFFALVLRRQGRTGSAVRWLRHYLSSFDARELNRDFAVILEATSYDAFGPEGQALLSATVDDWCRELRRDAEINTAQVQRWFGEIGSSRQALAPGQYETLARLSPEFPDLQRQLERASALPEVLAKYQTVRDMDDPMPTRLEDLLDDILDVLVTEFDEEELPLRRDVVFHETVIAEGGYVDRARVHADKLNRALEETIDVVSLQTTSAIDPALIGVGARTQRISVGVGHQDFATAVGRYCRAYREDAVDVLAFDFAPGHSEYSRSMAFAGVRLLSTTPEHEGVVQLQQAWARTVEALVAELSFTPRWYVRPGLVAGAVALLSFAMGAVVGLLTLVVAGVLVFGAGEMAKRKAAEAVAAVREQEAKALGVSVALYRDALAELVDARIAYRELDATEEPLLNLIAGWPTITAGTSEQERVSVS